MRQLGENSSKRLMQTNMCEILIARWGHNVRMHPEAIQNYNFGETLRGSIRVIIIRDLSICFFPGKAFLIDKRFWQI